ncbi:MAG TPA: ATP-binding cassette domain-containing protein [Desulfitobacterium dehalogenans]|uniref:ATP-binding cassette domain-containing protein n=1 Tax=Desulfitobacterium dehalogenans TaxID=36854 RepID=A0A7C6Z2J4_9FIRM|nr:ATP-binding cassette domain-containing protein [Desulfitobacterium dehalogenans]
MRLFIDLMWFFKKEKLSYIIGIILLTVLAVINLCPPYIVGKVVDGVTNQTLTMETLWPWLLILLCLGILSYILRYSWRILIFGAAARLSRLLRQQLFKHFTRMSPSFYQKYRTGDLMAHATNDIQAIEVTAGMGVLTLVDSLVTGGFVVFSMAAFLSWKLTLITLLPMPIMAWVSSYYGTLLHDRFLKAQEAFGDLNDKVQENISGVRVVKAFGQEEAEIESFRKLSDDVVKKNQAVAVVDSLYDPSIMLIVGISFFLAISFGAYEVVNLRLTLGQLTQFTLYLGQFIWPMLAFGWLFNIMERGRASYDRVKALLDVESEVQDQVSLHGVTGRSMAEPKKITKGDIVYALDQFTYPDQKKPVLKNIHFTLKEGQTLGVVGKTGSGKTTLFRALLREFAGMEGQIRIGGISIQEIPLDSLRGIFGYVPQEHFLFSTTLAENIALGKPNSHPSEIEKAAKMACIHEDIQRFEEQYATLVGDRGVTLSGGQKQRISIARALLLNPEVLILDDSLSAVDAKTEKQILLELKSNRSQKTTLISAHRLSAIEHADLILVLQNGEVLERGTHTELMENKGWYAETYQAQQLESLIQEGGGLS